MPVAAAFGNEHVWVVNHLDNSLTAIHSGTMKVVTTLAFEGVHGPNDIAWLPATENRDAQLAVVTSSGHLLIIDAQEVLTGGLQPVIATRQVGGILNRMVVDADAGLTYIADAKTRRVYRMETTTLSDEDGAVEGLAVTFAARDLHANGGSVWVATEMSLVEWTAERSSSNDLIRARAVGGVVEQAVATGALAVATTSRIENFDTDDLTRITDIAGTAVRRMMTLVAPR